MSLHKNQNHIEGFCNVARVFGICVTSGAVTQESTVGEQLQLWKKYSCLVFLIVRWQISGHYGGSSQALFENKNKPIVRELYGKGEFPRLGHLGSRSLVDECSAALLSIEPVVGFEQFMFGSIPTLWHTIID